MAKRATISKSDAYKLAKKAGAKFSKLAKPQMSNHQVLWTRSRQLQNWQATESQKPHPVQQVDISSNT